MWGRRATLLIWVAFAGVTWNVVFDRHVYLAAIEFTEEQIQRHQRGELMRPIEDGFRPRVREAAARASVWGGAVLAAGLAVTRLASRRGR